MSNQLAMVKKDTVDVVAAKVKQFQENKEIHFPANYSPENAMKSAWLILQNTKTSKKDGYKPALEICTKDSIANSLLDMVVQGLNPAKKQGYFIVYGNQLTFQRSYFGTMAVTKRVTGAKSIEPAVIYEGDDVDYEMINGKITNLVHKQKFGNIDKDKIQGAYCTIILSDDSSYTELMTIEELRKAWSKAQFWGDGQTVEKKGSTHEEFRQEMAKKTVINRACKKFLNSSDDGSLVFDHINREDDISAEVQLQEELEQNANGDIIDVEVKVVEEEKEPQKQEEIDASQDEPKQDSESDGPAW